MKEKDKFEECTVTARVGHEDIKVRLAFRDQRMGSRRLGFKTDEPVPLEHFRVTIEVEDETTSYEAVIDQVHALHDIIEGLLVCRVIGEDLYFIIRCYPAEGEEQSNWEADTGVLHMSRQEFQALMPGQQLAAFGYGF